MDSPLARVILAVLGGYLLILLCMSVYEWMIEAFPSRPNTPPVAERIQHPVYHEEALAAIELFSRLTKPEQTAIRENLKSNLVSLGPWLAQLAQSNFQILCIGERHEESTRIFLAEEFFVKVRTDTLLLEATPGKLKHLVKRMAAGRDYYPLLDADIMGPLRAAIQCNPEIRIRGIEETDRQQKDRGGPSNSRDHHIATNFWISYRPGKRNMILFGAMHCTNEANWLFQNLHDQASPPLRDRMLNVTVMGEHQNGPLEAFVFFLDEIGIQRKHFVISNTRLLHARVYELFKLLTRQTLDKYRSVIVFRL